MENKGNIIKELVGEFEVHNVEKIKKYFSQGIDPNEFYNGRQLIDVMITMYTRTQRFSDCIKAFVEYGLEIDDELLFTVLMNESADLKNILEKNPSLINKKYTIEGSAYIPLYDVSLMHICAEYNHVECAKILLKFGGDVNERGGINELGMGGQTPIFHTVNQNLNNSLDMLYFLLENGANLDITIQGIEWGLGHEWETMIPSINSISYAMMGLLPQMHRKQEHISEIVSLLMKHKYGIDYFHKNIPNKYLKTF